MKCIVFIFLVFCSLPAFADGPYYIRPAEEGLNMKPLEGQGITILPVHKPEPYNTRLPSMVEREKVFAKSWMKSGIN